MAEPEFAFYEKVRVQTANPFIAELNGLLAAVIGRTQNDDGSWGYVIHVYERPETYFMAEADLVATGEHAKREDFSSEVSIRVSRNGKRLE